MEEIDLLVTEGNVYTLNGADTVFSPGSVAVNNGQILKVGPVKELSSLYHAKREINAKGKYIFPGFINTHTHLFQTMLKGLARDKPLSEWLENVIRPHVPLYDAETSYLAALAGCIEAIHSGTTTVLDYMYANPEPQLCDAVLQAFDDVGIRGLLARGFSDNLYGSNRPQVMMEDFENVLADTLRLRKKYGTRIWLAPTALWNVTQEALLAVRDLALKHQIPVTMHLNETTLDQRFAQEKYGITSIEFLEQIGFLNERFLAVHCVYINEAETATLQKYGVKISYNPVSNMILGSGVMPLPLFEKYKITLSLGTDGAASNDSQNLLETMKLGALLPKVVYRDPTMMAAEDILRMVTMDGARALGLAGDIGSLASGKRADLIVYDPLKAQSFPMHDPLSTVVYASNPTNIDTVMIEGREVMRGGRLTTVDEEDVLYKARAAARRLVQK